MAVTQSTRIRTLPTTAELTCQIVGREEAREKSPARRARASSLAEPDTALKNRSHYISRTFVPGIPIDQRGPRLAEQFLIQIPSIRCSIVFTLISSI